MADGERPCHQRTRMIGLAGFIEQHIAEGNKIAIDEGGFDLAKLAGEFSEYGDEGLAVDGEQFEIDAEKLADFEDGFAGVVPG